MLVYKYQVVLNCLNRQSPGAREIFTRAYPHLTGKPHLKIYP